MYGNYTFCQTKCKCVDQADNCHYKFNVVDNSIHGLIIHTIRTVAIALVDEHVGGVRTLQNFGESRHQRNKSVKCDHSWEAECLETCKRHRRLHIKNTID